MHRAWLISGVSLGEKVVILLLYTMPLLNLTVLRQCRFSWLQSCLMPLFKAAPIVTPNTASSKAASTYRFLWTLTCYYCSLFSLSTNESLPQSVKEMVIDHSFPAYVKFTPGIVTAWTQHDTSSSTVFSWTQVVVMTFLASNLSQHWQQPCSQPRGQ